MQHGNLHIDIDTICYDNDTNNNNCIPRNNKITRLVLSPNNPLNPSPHSTHGYGTIYSRPSTILADKSINLLDVENLSLLLANVADFLPRVVFVLCL